MIYYITSTHLGDTVYWTGSHFLKSRHNALVFYSLKFAERELSAVQNLDTPTRIIAKITEG